MQQLLPAHGDRTTEPRHQRETMSRRSGCRLPTLDEQRAIAHILGTLDDKIELNRRMNETLEAMARALFKSWFVDFDPVRAKAEGRDPGLPTAPRRPASRIRSRTRNWGRSRGGGAGDLAGRDQQLCRTGLVVADAPHQITVQLVCPSTKSRSTELGRIAARALKSGECRLGPPYRRAMSRQRLELIVGRWPIGDTECGRSVRSKSTFVQARVRQVSENGSTCLLGSPSLGPIGDCAGISTNDHDPESII